MSYIRLTPLPFGLTLGAMWSLSLLMIGLTTDISSFAQPFTSTLGVFYLGYSTSIIGSIAGGIYGFIHGFVFGVMIAWLYNVFNSIC